MEQETLNPKWEATVSTRLANASADEIWALVKDFFGICKYFPNLSTSYGIQGSNGEVGSVRRTEGFEIPPKESKGINNGGNNNKPLVSWSEEKIIAIDPTQRSLSYDIVDCNIGFNSYVSTIKVIEKMSPESGESVDDDDDDDDEQGCVLEWSFSVDPVEGFKYEGLVKKYEVALLKMAQNMEDSLRKS